MVKGYIYDDTISLKAKGILALSECYPFDNLGWNIEKINRVCSDGKGSIRNTIKELISKGYLTVIKGKDNKGKWIYEYRFITKKEINNEQ